MSKWRIFRKQVPKWYLVDCCQLVQKRFWKDKIDRRKQILYPFKRGFSQRVIK